MITASHNPEQDNGVKIVDPMGEMLIAAWEAHATQIANVADQDLLGALEALIKEAKIDMQTKAHVVYAHDTRPSCPALVQALEDAFACFAPNATIRKGGLLTTPQLHYLVRTQNDSTYGESSETAYYEKLATAFKALDAPSASSSRLTVDCANGVGAPKFTELLATLERNGTPLSVTLVNDRIHTAGLLNKDCGADYVKTQQKAPPSLSPLKQGSEHDLFCSFDGDADRIVFYYADENGQFRLLDGDKIATLAAMHLIELVKTAGLGEQIRLGVVQTAYANGSSTTYLSKSQGVPVTCTPTGVKYLHHAAQQFDIGVYFEANGHGTVLFSELAVEALSTAAPSSPAQADALKQLTAYTDLINQTVGDAFSDLLLVKSILAKRDMTPSAWDTCYMDLPNKLVKALVKDRSIFKTTDAERKLIHPANLQAQIDALVAKYEGGRSFVRPSGTEDCVRVYAEATLKPQADELASKVAQLVTRLHG